MNRTSALHGTISASNDLIRAVRFLTLYNFNNPKIPTLFPGNTDSCGEAEDLCWCLNAFSNAVALGTLYEHWLCWHIRRGADAAQPSLDAK